MCWFLRMIIVICCIIRNLFLGFICNTTRKFVSHFWNLGPEEIVAFSCKIWTLMAFTCRNLWSIIWYALILISMKNFLLKWLLFLLIIETLCNITIRFIVRQALMLRWIWFRWATFIYILFLRSICSSFWLLLLFTSLFRFFLSWSFISFICHNL